MRRALELSFCIAGIYVCFLTWGVLQERLSSVDYSRPFSSTLLPEASFIEALKWTYGRIMTWLHGLFVIAIEQFYRVTRETVSPNFESFVLLNMVQSLGSVIISFFVLKVLTGSFPLMTIRDIDSFLERHFPSIFPKSLHRRKLPYSHLSKTYNPVAVKKAKMPDGKNVDGFADSMFETANVHEILRRKKQGIDISLFLQYVRLSVCFCLASPFGYASLKYIDYVTMNLGKSCKLLPLVIISIFFRGKKIETKKLLSLLMITVGVAGFVLLDGKKKTDNNAGLDWSLSLYGLFLLLINLALDGAMNTFQDEVFSQYKVSSFHMMFHMNWQSVALMLGYLMLPITGEFNRTLDSLMTYPRLFADVVLFGICGALGQAFVFYTIEKFGAVSLVTVTVTRKLFTILLSVAYFGHKLTLGQWASVSLVFLALGFETFSKHKKRIVPATLLLPKEPNLDEAINRTH